jgi:glyoxylase-like metal-dependent hydrolase (beta-lactamase superfamily II)/rhodanese-related sulfurtransferase
MTQSIFITPQDVKKRLYGADEKMLITDIREKEKFDDWHINGSINIPVDPQIAAGSIEEIKKALGSLPKDKEIVIVCSRGINSQLAANILREMKYRAVALNKGMMGWNENFDTHEIAMTLDDPRHNFTIVQFIRIGKGCLSYIVYNNASRAGIVVDPSILTDIYLDYINKNHLNINYVLDTHSHADHFSGGLVLAQTLNIDYYINKLDVYKDFNFRSLEGIEKLDFRILDVKIMKTPGHTDGSLSFLIENKALICGDLLLLESTGRPDLARTKEETKAGAEKIFYTIHDSILKLGDDVKIFPAHFISTELRPVVMTLSELKKHNIALTISDKEAFLSYITENMPEAPPNFETIKKFNKAGTYIPVDFAEDLELGPNRCAARI